MRYKYSTALKSCSAFGCGLLLGNDGDALPKVCTGTLAVMASHCVVQVQSTPFTCRLRYRFPRYLEARYLQHAVYTLSSLLTAYLNVRSVG